MQLHGQELHVVDVVDVVELVDEKFLIRRFFLIYAKTLLPMFFVSDAIFPFYADTSYFSAAR